MTVDLLTDRSAVFSRCGRYRYVLRITWDQRRPILAFCMLNPSTADEVANDPTVERCERRARSWGYGGIVVVNLFAWRSTDPSVLADLDDPVGTDNDAAILKAAIECERFVCGWGNSGPVKPRADIILHAVRAAGVVPHALKINADGTPAHPLYLPYRLTPQPMVTP